MDHGNSQPSKDKFNPRETASIFSIITFFYSIPLLKKGKKKDIEEKDIYRVIPEFQAQALGDKLESNWRQEKKNNKNASIIKCLVKTFGLTYLLFAIVQLICSTAIILFTPAVLSKFVVYFAFHETSLTKKDAYFYGASVIGLNLFNIFYTNNLQQLVIEYAIKVRTAICSLIYRKALKINPAAFPDSSIGKIVTLMSKDVFAIDSGLSYLKDMIIGFLQLAVVSYILYNKVGVSALPAMGFILIVLPLQMLVGKFTTKARIKAAKKTDERFRLLQETLGSIKIIKMYAWETYFVKFIHKARLKETTKIKIVYYLKALIVILGATTINIAFYILLLFYIARGYSIEAETVYYVQTCLGAIKISISLLIPLGITQTSDMLASLKRIQWFLDTEEIRNSQEITNQPPSLRLNKVKVVINRNEVLKSVSLNIDSGLLLITGNVGSGKSALLKTILGEYPVSSGEITVNGTLSFATEDPWLFPSTIRQNILFGQPYDEERYLEVLNVCALTYDMNKLEKHDQTIVGDKGFNLSKGQQARIALARAVYRDSDVYLLDDCLSPLDNHVNKHIFNHCIKGFLKNKICLLVTNNINNVKTVSNNNILYIENGSTLTLEEQRDALDKRITYFIDEDDPNMKAYSRISKFLDKTETIEEKFEETDALLESKDYGQLDNIYHEEKKEGKVLWSNYVRYYRFLGGALVVVYLFTVFMISQFCLSYSEKIISLWVNMEPSITKLEAQNETNTAEYQKYLSQRNKYLQLYSIFVGSAIILLFVRSYSVLLFCVNAARKLHKEMIKSMLRAYMYFFDDHFIGNIINRLSKDFSVLDEQMPYLWFDCCRIIFSIGGAILLVASVNWIFFIPAAILLAQLYYVRGFYLPTGRSLRRLEAATRSPIIGYLNSTLEGLPVVRAAQQQHTLREEFDRHQDLFTSAYYMTQSTMRFFTFCLDIFGSMFMSGLILYFLIFSEGVTAGEVGLAISQSLVLSQLLQYAIRQVTEVENTMTSVERVLEYSDVQVEPQDGQVLTDWPTSGTIEYNNVSLTYKSDGNPVLKNINLKIEGGHKIGIVGRTGAGKSSIISTIFRLYNYEGKIIIDNVNIANLSLDCLRSKIAIIPQDPILFSGTIRTNIDPFDKYSDSDIWSALEKVHMKSLITNLNQEINDLSASYSSGQKQLLCLARALIQNNKIIVLDEATANLDPETEQLLQKTIEETLRNCTVITIAHRLHSVMNCDTVLVLDAGTIVENDKPALLLKNRNGFLSRMVHEETFAN
ncbi:hypothetical protein ABEB36_002717 [Hypothenemus hampei]|uniref:Uncharacterized protein n=1 Tax=Hypothenemus hampei TaxID=57062 RepID=A0ABD1F6S2_HYPHA